MSRKEQIERTATSRRELLRAAGVGALGLTSLGASASVGSAQVTVTAAISDNAPSFSDEDDYTGLFVHVRSVSDDQTADRLDSCAFFESDDEPLVYVARLIDRTTEDHPSEETLLYTLEGTDEIDVGNLYVVNRQQSCDGPLVELSMESVGGSPIEVSNGTGGGDTTGEESPADDEATDEATDTTAPGFGPLAGVTGVGSAALLFRRLGGSDE
ncbi:hypothetical protein [Haloprofundus halobius]|uniref:hypothetical protein n=1 Tax=Haloprofundus halobius TaxID=2876194 RepID=UPI001CCC14CD|nr:hypothetical protein [Haloprofundus halobius]